ncbi:hypothetical protein P7C70_g5603, partial [Phenoliferia sp. Uapishka_3]
MSQRPTTPTATSSPQQPRHAHSHSHSHSPTPPRTNAINSGAYRASVDASGGGAATRGWASSPRVPGNAARPTSELLAATSGQSTIPGAFASAESRSHPLPSLQATTQTEDEVRAREAALSFLEDREWNRKDIGF